MKRRDFVKLFATVPTAIGAATALGNTNAAKPIIEILMPNKELILPDKDNKLDLSHTLIIDRIVSLNFNSNNNLQNSTDMRPLMNDDDYSYGRQYVNIEIECFLYKDIANRLVDGKIRFFQTNILINNSIGNTNYTSINRLKFALESFKLNALVDSSVTANITGIKMQGDFVYPT